MSAGTTVAHVVVSRSSTGSSARFVSSFAAAFMGMQHASATMGRSKSTHLGSMTNMMAMTGNSGLSTPLKQNLSGKA